jgi:hypothetical protein
MIAHDIVSTLGWTTAQELEEKIVAQFIAEEESA